MVNVLLATLMELIDTHKDHSSGNTDAQSLIEAKKRFSSAFNDMVDHRINIFLETKRRNMSNDRIAVADSMSSNLTSNAKTLKSVAALNCAPAPLQSRDSESIKVWFEAYEDWYKTHRRSGMTFE
jgi:hypothetical protein